MNLAWMLAQTDAVNCLIIDADLRMPSLADYLGIETDKGLSDVLSGTASLTDQYLDSLSRTGNDPRTGGALYTQAKGQIAVQSYGITATQTLFNGLQTAGRTRQAEGQVFSAREQLRTAEQTVLLSAATAYMNLLQTAAILELQRSNVNVLEVTLRQTRDRFTAGEVTRTDVAQAESRLSGGRSQLSLAESNYVTAQAQYLQRSKQESIPLDGPGKLANTLMLNWDHALLFRDLATLRAGAPLFKSVDELEWRGPLPEAAVWAERIDGMDLLKRAERAADKLPK